MIAMRFTIELVTDRETKTHRRAGPSDRMARRGQRPGPKSPLARRPPRSDPGLTVGEIVVAWVLGQPHLERGDDLAGCAPGEPGRVCGIASAGIQLDPRVDFSLVRVAVGDRGDDKIEGG